MNEPNERRAEERDSLSCGQVVPLGSAGSWEHASGILGTFASLVCGVLCKKCFSLRRGGQREQTRVVTGLYARCTFSSQSYYEEALIVKLSFPFYSS